MIHIADVSFSYSEQLALSKIDLSISAGDFLVVFGADNAGKTTLLHILMGFITNYQGTAEVFSKNPNDLTSEEQNWVRYVPDDIIWEQITASEYFAAWQERTPEYDYEWQEDLCEAFAISPDVSLMNMTYNENKSVQLTAAICAKPDLLILDEPANFLDEKNYAFLLKALKRLNELGTTILLAAEKYADAKGYCYRYAYLKEGMLKECGDVPYPDQRPKVILVSGGNKTYLERNMSGVIENAFVKDEYFEAGYARSAYIYHGEMEHLPDLLHRAACRDFCIEEMTFEEEIDMDLSRWSYE